MNSFKFAVDWQNLFRFAIWLLLGLMACLRFSNISADPPLGFTGSISYTYTDEGWWARNAVAIVREGQWYIDDGYNPIFSLPVVPLLQTLWFKIFGVSLTAARSLNAVLTIILSGLVYLLTKRFIKSDLALLAPLVILTNFSIFVYSRLALLDIPTTVFVVISVCFVLNRDGRVNNFRIVLSALFLLIAILAKTTAIFGLPMIIALIWLQSSTLNDKIRQTIVFLAVFLVAFLTVSFFSFTYGSTSFTEFGNRTVLGKFNHSFSSLLIAPVRISYRICQLFPVLFPLSLLSILIIRKTPQYRSHPLVLLAISWFGASIWVLLSTSYSPARYMINFCVPIAIVIPLVVEVTLNSDRQKILSKVILCILMLSYGISTIRLVNYFASIDNTFVSMARNVGEFIQQQKEGSKVLMGPFADSVSLVSDIKSVNDQIGYRDLDYRIQKFNPGYYISLGAVSPEIADSLEEYYSLELLKTYDVYDNHHQDLPVFFYQLKPI